MRIETLRRVLRGRRRSLIGWAAGIVAMVALIVFAYPAVRDQSGFSDLLDEYPDFVKEILGLGGGLDIASPEGYLNSQLFANLLPIILLIFLIAFAVRETAGEEDDGTMDLSMAHPVSRERYLLEKFGAMTVAGAGLSLLSMLTLIALGPAVDMGLPLSGYIGATVSVFLIAMVFASLAMALAASTGSRGVSFGVTAALAVGLFVLWGLAPLVDALSGFDRVNPYFWGFAGTPIANGLQVGNALLLAAITVVFAGLAVVGYRRRDLGV